MIDGVIIKDIKKYEDDRGYLQEIYRRDEIDTEAAMAYYSLTKPGVSRGPHEHRYQSDFFVFIGPGNFRLYLWDKREDSPTKGEKMEIDLGEVRPASVLVPPGVVHGYKCISETAAISINFPNKLYKGLNKQEEVDEIRWEEDPTSPYKID